MSVVLLLLHLGRIHKNAYDVRMLGNSLTPIMQALCMGGGASYPYPLCLSNQYI